MKKNKKTVLRMLTAILLSAVFVACSKEAPPTVVQQVAGVSFATRGTLGTDIWQTGDQVKLSVKNGDSKIYQYDEQSGWSASGGVPLSAEFPATFSACSPATANNTNFTMPTIAGSDADQSSAAKLRAADYMASDEIERSTAEASVNLTLEHRMCRVTIQIESYDAEFGGTIPPISNVKVLSKSSGVQHAGNSWTAMGSAVNVLSFVEPDNTNGLHTYNAIVSPGTYPAGDKLMTLTVGSGHMSVPLTTATTFVSGKAYAFTMKVRKYIAPTLTATYVGGWNNETDL